MNSALPFTSSEENTATVPAPVQEKNVKTVPEAIVEIVSDSGEGSQTAGQMFGAISARMGNGVWTVEIIPAEIEPPARSLAGASGNRIRVGTGPITNMGDTADVVVAFNEKVPYSRMDKEAFRKGTQFFLENKWADDPREEVRASYAEAVADFKRRGYVVRETAMEKECLKHVSNPRRGKNMWVLGLLCRVFDRDMKIAREEVAKKFNRKGEKVVEINLELLQAGYDWTWKNISLQYHIPIRKSGKPMVVMNGNQAMAVGAMAAGFEICSMYPITPATSVTHYLASVFKSAGGFVHQAEDEIAAIGFAIGASYAGKTALTVTSGPGLALKTEFTGLSVMAEIPLVLVDVQRGGPSTGLPTRVEQSDLMTAYYASPGDAPRVVLAPSTIEECFHFMITARKLAEMFRGLVIILTDANLATGVQPFPAPQISEDWLSPPLDLSPWDKKVKAYDWDPETGLSQRPIPGQKGGEYILTGLAHDETGRIVYVSKTNQRTTEMRSRKLATLQRSLKPPTVYGSEEGDLLVVGWGSTRGAIEEAIDRVRKADGSASSLHLRFLSPLEPGLKEIFSRFKQVMTVEINYSDSGDPSERGGAYRRYSQLAMHLRAHTLVDVDCFTRVPGIPFSPHQIEGEIRHKLNMK